MSNSKRTRNIALATVSDSKKNVSLAMISRDTSDSNQLWQFQPIKDAEGENVAGCWSMHGFGTPGSLNFCLTRSSTGTGDDATGLLTVEQIKSKVKGPTRQQMWYIGSTSTGEGKWTISESPIWDSRGGHPTKLDVKTGTDTAVAIPYAGGAGAKKPPIEDMPWGIQYVKAVPAS